MMGTRIINCINRATITTKDGTANGGILGHVYSGECTIEGCVNYGTINVGFDAESAASKCLGAGGILGNTNVGSPIAGHDLPSCTISNCINNGNITSVGESTGGIAGQLGGKSGCTNTFTIEGCTNNGTITGSSNGTGGILGASSSATTCATILSDCVNKGNVVGVSYVGGIVGIARQNNSDSLIENCDNYGNVTASNISAGGIAGLSRFDVVNCNCYFNALISSKDANGLASAINAIGETKNGTGGGTGGAAGPTVVGYIVGTQGSRKTDDPVTTVTGKLIKADGSDYVPEP